MIISGGQNNLWILVVVAKYDGTVVMMPLDVPKDLYRRTEQFLRNELGKPIGNPAGSA